MKTINPLVSVLLPYAGDCPFLEDAVKSVTDQDYSHFELVLVDNGDDPVTTTRAELLARDDQRIRIINEKKKGISFALNTGLLQCNGNLVARMDADDICLPGRLFSQAKYLNEHPETALVSGRIRFLGDQLKAQGFSEYITQLNGILTNDQINRYRFLESPFAHPSVMFRKSVIEMFGGYTESPGCPEDYELWLRLLEGGIVMHKLDQDVLEWRDSPNRLSRIHPAYSKAAFDDVRLRYVTRWILKRKPSASVLIWGAGKLARRKAMKLSAAGIPIKGFIDVSDKSRSGSLPVVHYKSIPPPGEAFVVSMVSNRGKAFEIEDFLIERGYREGKDFLLCG